MPTITIYLRKPHKNSEVIFQAELLQDRPAYRLVRANWGRPRLDLGYMVFEPDDCFYEHYYADRWYALFEICDSTGRLKGWYGNISRPAIFEPEAIISVDLDLDLFVSADRSSIVRLDLEEFEQRGLAISDPSAYAAAYAALDELEQCAIQGMPPFDSHVNAF